MNYSRLDKTQIGIWSPNNNTQLRFILGYLLSSQVSIPPRSEAHLAGVEIGLARFQICWYRHNYILCFIC